MKTLPIDAKDLLRWLRMRERDTRQSRNRYTKEHNYGAAQLSEGLSQAYAYTILHVERVLEGQP